MYLPHLNYEGMYVWFKAFQPATPHITLQFHRTILAPNRPHFPFAWETFLLSSRFSSFCVSDGRGDQSTWRAASCARNAHNTNVAQVPKPTRWSLQVDPNTGNTTFPHLLRGMILHECRILKIRTEIWRRLLTQNGNPPCVPHSYMEHVMIWDHNVCLCEFDGDLPLHWYVSLWIRWRLNLCIDMFLMWPYLVDPKSR